MNMAVRIVEDMPGEHLPSCAFRRVHKITPTVPARSRYLSGLIVILGHMALIAALLWGGSKVYQAVRPEPITVAIIAATPSPSELPPPPPPPKLDVPQPDVAIAPEITIATPPPSKAIAVQQVKTEPPPPSSSPVGGTSRDAYLAKILAYLDAAKRYPPQARKLHIEGVVQLHFVMDRNGRVLSFDIAKSSGRPILDEESKRLIFRAQPLPPIPADWPQQTLDLVVPVEFELH